MARKAAGVARPRRRSATSYLTGSAINQLNKFIRLQKWSKGKQKEKVNAAVFFDKNLYEKLKKEVPSYKLITPSIISERMRCDPDFCATDELFSDPLPIE